MQEPPRPDADETTASEAETESIGAALGRELQGGEAVLLHGELGAGKTAFVRGLARGLGAPADEVASPTFVLLTRYEGRLRLHHADLYRLAGDGDDRELGLEELPGPTGVIAVEWAERLSHNPWPSFFKVVLEHAGGDRRRVRVLRRGSGGAVP